MGKIFTRSFCGRGNEEIKRERAFMVQQMILESFGHPIAPLLLSQSILRNIKRMPSSRKKLLPKPHVFCWKNLHVQIQILIILMQMGLKNDPQGPSKILKFT